MKLPTINGWVKPFITTKEVGKGTGLGLFTQRTDDQKIAGAERQGTYYETLSDE